MKQDDFWAYRILSGFVSEVDLYVIASSDEIPRISTMTVTLHVGSSLLRWLLYKLR